MISFQLHLLEQTRKNFLNLIQGLSNEQLNKIPNGYHNNLIWNFGHVVVTQQILCYKLSALPMNLNNEIIDKYRKGSSPEAHVSDEEIALLKKAALDLVEQTRLDYIEGKFKNFEKYPTSYGIELNHIEEAMSFNNTHEGLHFGVAMSLKKLV
ncbi:MAG: DinB family protein [Bacteroidia bacterium]